MGILVPFGGFTYTQATAASTWTIDHNLGRYPVVDVVVSHNGVDEVILPKSIQHASLSQVVVTFSEPLTGSARLA